MAGLVPWAFSPRTSSVGMNAPEKNVDHRVKPGDDDCGRSPQSSVGFGCRRQQFWILHHSKGIGSFLDHDTPVFGGERLVGFATEGAFSDRRVEGHAQQRLGYGVALGAS